MYMQINTYNTGLVRDGSILLTFIQFCTVLKIERFILPREFLFLSEYSLGGLEGRAFAQSVEGR